MLRLQELYQISSVRITGMYTTVYTISLFRPTLRECNLNVPFYDLAYALWEPD